MLKSRRDRPSKPAASPPPAAEPTVRTVTRKDLPLSCPMPDAEVWNMHPRVYLPIEDDPKHEATCPYCGARYKLRDE